MSLGNALYQHLATQPDFLEVLPGGLQPDIGEVPDGISPRAIYATANGDDRATLDGETEFILETLTVSIWANTKTDAETAAKWIHSKLKSIRPATVTDPKVFYWRRTGVTDAGEIELEGSDQPVNVFSLNVVGAYKPPT